MFEFIKFSDGETKVLTINLSEKITTVLSKFPVKYRDKNGIEKQFFPLQTIFTMTDGGKLYANTYLASDISRAIMDDTEVIHGKKTITLEITRTGTQQDTRYLVSKFAGDQK